MGMKTWRVAAKAAGAQVSGRVIVARDGTLNWFDLEVGEGVAAELERAARGYRPVREAQPQGGEIAEQLAGLTVFARAMLGILRKEVNTPAAEASARLLVTACGSALELEPRFVRAYGLAVAAREQVEDGRFAMVRELCAHIDAALPRFISGAGEADRLMQVEVKDLAFPGAIPGTGMAKVNLNMKFTEVNGGSAAKAGDSTVLLPLPLFGLGQSEPLTQAEMMVDGLQVIVDLKGKRSAYGALRAMLLAAEQTVADYAADYEEYEGYGDFGDEGDYDDDYGDDYDDDDEEVLDEEELKYS